MAEKTARIGYLAFPSGPSHVEEAFRQGLRDLGYVDGENISIEYRWADFKPDRVSGPAAELVRLKVDIIVSTTLTMALAAKKATKTIPIVFLGGVAHARPAGRYQRADDGTVLQQIRAVTNSRATYGYRWVWAMVNRIFRTGYNRKRIRRIMQLHGLMLPPRVHRRHGRPHLGQAQQPASNQRWCSGVFLIPCWSGEVISVAFDRLPRPGGPGVDGLAMRAHGADIRTLMDRTLWARFGEATLTAPHAIQWLSDNGSPYTATATVLYAHELGLVPIMTPAYSPQSNGLAEASVHIFRRDYIDGADLRDAETVLAQLVGLVRRLQQAGAAPRPRDAAADRAPAAHVLSSPSAQ